MEEILKLLKHLEVDSCRISFEPSGTISIRGNVDWSGKLKDGKIPFPIENVYGNFDVSHNNLVSLENSPKHVFGLFNCSSNQLKSLKGGPLVCTTFRCINNPELMDLEFAPFWTKECQAYFEGTAIAQQAKEIHHRACQLAVWDAGKTWDENMNTFYREFPLECKKWSLLDAYFNDHRGSWVGEQNGIL